MDIYNSIIFKINELTSEQKKKTEVLSDMESFLLISNNIDINCEHIGNRIDSMMNSQNDKNQEEDMEHPQDVGDEFKKSWSLLNKTLKLDRIAKYANEYQGINNKQRQQLKEVLVMGLNERQITSKNDVEYDQENAKIIKFNRLIMNNDELFVLEPKTKTTRVTKIKKKSSPKKAVQTSPKKAVQTSPKKAVQTSPKKAVQTSPKKAVQTDPIESFSMCKKKISRRSSIDSS